MGLDAVELLIAVEEEFQIAISDSEASECATVGKLVKLVHARLRQSQLDSCPSQQAFYIVRRQLMQQFQIPRGAIKPETELNDVIPADSRKECWERLITGLAGEVSFNSRLVRPKWIRRRLIPALNIIVFSGLLCAGFSFGLALIATLAAALAIEFFSRRFSTDFPDGMAQVRDLIKLVTTLDPKVWSELEVFLKVRSITAAQLGIDESLITPEARFVDDLGMG